MCAMLWKSEIKFSWTEEQSKIHFDPKPSCYVFITIRNSKNSISYYILGLDWLLENCLTEVSVEVFD